MPESGTEAAFGANAMNEIVVWSNSTSIEKKSRWDQRYIRLARHVAAWSKDPRARVGAVIASPEKGRVIALGFNGFPVGIEDDADRLQDSDLKRQVIVHAEQNALLFAGQKANKCSIYVAGKPVCERCAVLIIQAGIREVIARHPDTLAEDSKWRAGAKLALQLFEEAGVKFRSGGESDPIDPDGLASPVAIPE